MSKLQIYLVLCQAVSLRSRPVYLGALSDDLDKVLIDLDDNTNRSEYIKSNQSYQQDNPTTQKFQGSPL